MIPGAGFGITELEGSRVAVLADDVNNDTMIVPVELYSRQWNTTTTGGCNGAHSHGRGGWN